MMGYTQMPLDEVVDHGDYKTRCISIRHNAVFRIEVFRYEDKRTNETDLRLRVIFRDDVLVVYKNIAEDYIHLSNDVFGKLLNLHKPTRMLALKILG